MTPTHPFSTITNPTPVNCPRDRSTMLLQIARAKLSSRPYNSKPKVTKFIRDITLLSSLDFLTSCFDESLAFDESFPRCSSDFETTGFAAFPFGLKKDLMS